MVNRAMTMAVYADRSERNLDALWLGNALTIKKIRWNGQYG